MKAQTYTSKQVCEIVNVSMPTLDRWQHKGILIPVIVGGKGAVRRYSKTQIDAFLGNI